MMSSSQHWNDRGDPDAADAAPGDTLQAFLSGEGLGMGDPNMSTEYAFLHHLQNANDGSIPGRPPNSGVPVEADASMWLPLGRLSSSNQDQDQFNATQQASSISEIDAQIAYLQRQRLYQQQHIQLQLQSTRNDQNEPIQQFQDSHTGPCAYLNNGHSVPPTPQSLEIVPGSGHFYSQGDQTPHSGIFDGGYPHNMQDQQDMAFTPLVSPAVTPLETFFNMGRPLSMPNSYFSPLTSPALHAQNDVSAGYGCALDADSSAMDLDLETPLASTPARGPAPPPKEKPKSVRNMESGKSRKSAVKNSPIAKPSQRRKPGHSPAKLSRGLQKVSEQAAADWEASSLPPSATAASSSEENASVSPENLYDMPPPPVPMRALPGKSPRVQAQDESRSNVPNRLLSDKTTTPSGAGGPIQPEQPFPATPASLMRLPSSKMNKRPRPGAEVTVTDDDIEALLLPESSASPKEALYDEPDCSASSGTAQDDVGAKALPTAQAPSSSQSPSIKEAFAPAFPTPPMPPGPSGPRSRVVSHTTARSSRKSSAGSVRASPALLPKISPNIKPLLAGKPGEGPDDEAFSRLLTTKSNYQNILEGNKVPGLSYSSELSTRVNSKRATHRISEQGRRERISSAMRTLGGMIPNKYSGGCAEDDEEKAATSTKLTSSKAITVEGAIAYIRDLQQENERLKSEIQLLKT